MFQNLTLKKGQLYPKGNYLLKWKNIVIKTRQKWLAGKAAVDWSERAARSGKGYWWISSKVNLVTNLT